MISKFVREQKRYTQSELCDVFECSEEKVIPFIRKLKEYGILKAVKASDSQKDMSDLLDEDIEVSDVEIGENEYLYVFTFVGVVTVAGRIIKCYPKYLLSNSAPKNDLKVILNVLQKYNTKEQIVRMFNNGSDSQSFNLLAVLLFLLNDYFENGSYNNTEEVIESNGSGEILWDKTINETFTLLHNNKPYYTDLQTRKRITNDFDYFKRLHECLITKASKELENADLLDLFDISSVNLSDEKLDDFGDKAYILYRIENELNIQFNTRKQLVLKALYAYIDKSGSLYDIDCLSMFGTTNFNLVWEDVCKTIFNNQLDMPLGLMKLPIPLNSKYDKKTKLIDLIEKPFWSVTNTFARDTLIPDCVSIEETENGYVFIISDAKYYNAVLEQGKVPLSQPGIESVTKQYLYQLAYQSFIADQGFSRIVNCFLLPTESTKSIDKGYVSLNILHDVGLQDIKVRLLPASDAYDCYLSGKKMLLSSLNL